MSIETMSLNGALAVIARHRDSHKSISRCNGYSAQEYPRLRDAHDAVAALIEREAALVARNAELERLCDATYVAKGADAYNHACETMAAWQKARAKAEKDAGCEGSLCDGLSWLQSRVDSLEAERDALEAALRDFVHCSESLSHAANEILARAEARNG